MRAALLALTLLLAATANAFAQDASVRFIETPISDQTADQVLVAAVAALPGARGADGQPLAPLSEAERSQPLLDRDLVREVMDIGLASGVGEACDLPWAQQNFLPLMQRERARGDRTEHQLATIAIVHGLIQGQAAGAGACGPAGAAAATAFYQRKWGGAVGP